MPGVASSYTFLYGSLSAVMAVLAWAYLSSLSILWGAQLSYTYSRTRGSHVGAVGPPAPKVVPRRRQRGPEGFRGLMATVVSWLLPPKKNV